MRFWGATQGRCSPTGVAVKGAIDALPQGQWEAAAALGLGWGTTLRKVIMPQAIRGALPGYGNEIVLLIKASSITMAAVRFAFRLLEQSFFRW
ncbi:ABC transporter permease subunit [Rhizobium sp. NPDC092017]